VSSLGCLDTHRTHSVCATGRAGGADRGKQRPFHRIRSGMRSAGSRRRFSIRGASSLIRCFSVYESSGAAFSYRINITRLRSAGLLLDPDGRARFGSSAEIVRDHRSNVRQPPRLGFRPSARWSVVSCVVLYADLSVFYDRAGRFVLPFMNTSSCQTAGCSCIFLVHPSFGCLPFVL